MCCYTKTFVALANHIKMNSTTGGNLKVLKCLIYVEKKTFKRKTNDRKTKDRPTKDRKTKERKSKERKTKERKTK